MMLASCAQPTQAPAPTEEQAAEETEAPAPAEEEAVEITYMRQAEGHDIELDFIKEFEEANPNIKVNVDSVPANDNYTKLVLTTNAGNPPDVFMSFWTIDAATNNLIEPLNDYIDAAEFEKRFTPAARGYGEWQGTIYAIPWRSGASIFMMNCDMLEAAGLEVPASGWTWDDLEAYAEAMTDADNGVYGLALSGASTDFGTEWQFWPFLLQNGGVIIDENNRAGFNSPEGVAALEFLMGLNEKGVIPPGLASTDVNQIMDLQASGKVGMWEDGPWFIGIEGSSYPDLNLCVGPMTSNVKPGNIAGGTALGMSPLSKNKEAAWKFIEYMTSDDVLTRWAVAFEHVPPIYAAFDEPIFQDGNMKVAVEAVQEDGVIVANQYPESTKLNTIIRNYIQAAYLGEMTAQEALDQAKVEWDEVLKNYDQ
jgi:multiple sugar transport system substrate-binding protein